MAKGEKVTVTFYYMTALPRIPLYNTYGLTLHLQIRFAAFAFCFKTNLSGIFVGDRGDGKRVAVAAVLGLIL